MSNREFCDFEKAVRLIYGDGFIPLHRPVFEGNERAYLVDCIDSNFVSSVGAKVTEFELENHLNQNPLKNADNKIFTAK